MVDVAGKDVEFSQNEQRTSTSSSRYSQVAVGFHWSTGALVLLALPLGWYGATFDTALGQSVTNLHKAIGIMILALTLGRLAWRIGHDVPPLPAEYPAMLRTAARLTHAAFYVLLLVLPLSGWWMSSAVPNRHPFGITGWFDVPFLPVPRGMASAGPAHALHVNLAWAMAALVILHIAAALKHHFVDRDDTLFRMLPLSFRR